MKIRSVVIVFLGVLLGAGLVDASVSDGTIDPGFNNAIVCHDAGCATGSPNIPPGVINFAPTVSSGDVIHITDTGITGKAWGTGLGWITMQPSTGGGVTIDPATGLLSGKAWSQVSGWINFRPSGGGTSAGLPIGVQITATGEFQGWAWTGGPEGGWIKFDCSTAETCVQTDWRPIFARESHTPPSGGGRSSSGSIAVFKPQSPDIITPSSETTTCTPYLTSYIKKGATNNPEQVKKLQQFLNQYQAESLVVDGIYKDADFSAVMRFQELYRDQILLPWKLKHPTGFVYITTVGTINKISCGQTSDASICPYFNSYHTPGDTGSEITKIQKFLNTILGTTAAPVTDTYDIDTTNAIKQFQKNHSASILVQWGLVKPTGIWYKTTRKKANEFMGCTEPAIAVFR